MMRRRNWRRFGAEGACRCAARRDRVLACPVQSLEREPELLLPPVEQRSLPRRNAIDEEQPGGKILLDALQETSQSSNT